MLEKENRFRDIVNRFLINSTILASEIVVLGRHFDKFQPDFDKFQPDFDKF